MKQCELCTNEVMPEERFCPSCYDQIPAQFECIICGEKCNKDDNEFGGYEPTDNGDKPICLECVEISREDSEFLLQKYHEEEEYQDFFSDEYFDEML